MVAKIIASGASRGEAIARTADALRATRVEGIRSNREFLIACLADSEFAAGNISTRFIEERGKLLSQAANGA
jgi:acetyl-CoA carboxylase biotin carboxylase subunit